MEAEPKVMESGTSAQTQAREMANTQGLQSIWTRNEIGTNAGVDGQDKGEWRLSSERDWSNREKTRTAPWEWSDDSGDKRHNNDTWHRIPWHDESHYCGCHKRYNAHNDLGRHRNLHDNQGSRRYFGNHDVPRVRFDNCPRRLKRRCEVQKHHWPHLELKTHTQQLPSEYISMSAKRSFLWQWHRLEPE